MLLLVVITLQIQGQIYLDDFKPRLIINCSGDSTINDSLFQKIGEFDNFKEIYIALDSGEATINLERLKKAEWITFVGNGLYNITYNGCDSLLNIKKIEIRAKLLKLDFGDGLLSLEKLIIVYAMLTEIPKSINTCVNLLYLDLSYNEIDSFSNELCNLHKLRELAFESNNLSELPLGLLKNKELQSVNFGLNQFTEFPLVLLNMPKLRVISFLGNKMTDIPYNELENNGVELYY